MPTITELTPSIKDSAQTTSSDAAKSARDRAISILQGKASADQQTPVPNPNQVAPEDMHGVLKTEQSSEVTSSSSEQKLPSDSTEAPKVATDPAQKSDPLSSQYALLARKEKALRAKMQEAKAKEDAIKAREEAIARQEEQYKSQYVPKERLSKETLAVLNEMGITYDQLAQQALNQPTPEEIQRNQVIAKLESQIQELENKLNASSKQYQDNQQQAYKQAINQIRNEATQIVNSPDVFVQIKTTGSVNDVVDLIEKTFKADGIILSVEEACQQVEDYLIEESIKLAKMKKVQSRLTTPSTSAKQTMADSTKQAAAPTATTQQQQTKTLSNAMTSTKSLSPRERAILAMQGKLK